MKSIFVKVTNELPLKTSFLIVFCNKFGRGSTHKKTTKLIPKQFRFVNSSTQIAEYDSQDNSVRDSAILCSHFLPRPSNSRKKIDLGTTEQ